MGFYNHTDKQSGDGLALTDWNNLSSAIAGNQGLTLALSQNDKVGIGTRNPTAKLEVSGGAIRPAAGNDENSGILFPKNPGGGRKDAAWLRYYAREGEATTLELGISNDAGDHIALMPSGNVGIGTISPGEKLEVDGKVKATHFIGDGSQLTHLSVGLNGLNLATQSGNVGIGTTSPSRKLEVAGIVKITGSDLMLDDPARRSGQSGNHRRALVHDHGDKLIINYAGDYTGGVHIRGDVRIGGGTPITRIIAGNVDIDGNRAGGSGFTCTRTDTGRYTVTFSSAFSQKPVAVATCTDNDDDNIVSLGVEESRIRISIYDVDPDNNGSRENASFSFIAIGV